jgi:hypothetical protein
MSYYGQNPLGALQSGLEQLKSGIQAGVAARVKQIFADIDPEESPLAHGIGECGAARLDLLDRTVHAIAELEKRLPDRDDKAA